MPLAPLKRPLRIGTDCSGMETPVMALRRLKVAHDHKFSCDIDGNVKKQLQTNFPDALWFDDLMTRNNRASSTPAVDLYVAGFPCQSFSTQGLRKGFKDKRGKVFYGCADYILSKKPRAFILENVKGLRTHDKGKTMKHVLSTLRDIGGGAYDVEWQLLDTKQHGVPQQRPRIYLVGIRKDCKQHAFHFPQPLPEVSIEKFLDPPVKRTTLEDLPPKGNSNFYANVKRIVRRYAKEGKDPLRRTYCIDAESTPQFCTVAEDRVMCMTKSRASGHWVSSRGRRMNLNEMLRLQGMEKCFKQVVTDRQLGAQIGNAMSQNVLERILIQLLPAAGLIDRHAPLIDRWAKKAGKKRAAQVKVGTTPKRRRGGMV